jgi:hypothetical protein
MSAESDSVMVPAVGRGRPGDITGLRGFRVTQRGDLRASREGAQRGGIPESRVCRCGP